MSKVTAKGFMFMEYESDWAHDDWNAEWRPRWLPYKRREDEKCIYVGPMDVEFTVPDDFNPLPTQVAAIEAAKAEALAAYQSTVAELNERLSKLQALTFDAEAA